MTVLAAQRVRSRIRRGSSSPVVVDTEGGAFLVKLRGAGQGPAALVAELIVGALADSLGLPVPERRIVELAKEVPSDDRNDELADLLGRSVGLNVGVRWMEGATDARPEELSAIEDDYAVRVLWLDAFTMNPDRTDANPNIMVWNKQPWLIDHGAALFFQHDWRRVTEQTPEEPWDLSTHVFRSRLPKLGAWLGTHIVKTDSAALRRFAPAPKLPLDQAAIRAAVATVPDELMTAVTGIPDAARGRALYEAFLWKRLRARVWQ